MALGMIFAPEESKAGIVMCWEITLAVLCAVALQTIFFTPYVIKKMAYVARLVLFGICLHAMLGICGVLFAWFPADNVWALLSFTIAYLVILAIMTLVFSSIYRRDLQAPNKGLEDFKATGR